MSDLSPSEELGALLRGWREAMQLNQAAVAEAIGVKPAAVSLHESGDRLPEVDRLDAYVRLYGRTEADFNHLVRLLVVARRARLTQRALTGSYAGDEAVASVVEAA